LSKNRSYQLTILVSKILGYVKNTQFGSRFYVIFFKILRTAVVKLGF